MTRIMVTGAGGAAAVSFMKAVSELELEIHAADRDPLAAGLYWVPPSRRLTIPSAEDPLFARRVLRECCNRGIEVLVPTVDAELESLAELRHEFSRCGVALLLASSETLRCLDKWTLLQMCEGRTTLPRTELLDELLSTSSWRYPCVVKPRRGSGSRGVRIVMSEEELKKLAPNRELLVQEYLPGAEYSVDVLAAPDGQVVAAVPRERLKVDSGVAVASCIVRDEDLMLAATRVAQAIGLQFMANIQFKRREDGTAVLLEVNPRFPGTLPLTVEAGVNMPQLCLKYVLKQPVEHPIGEFKVVAVVRYWQEKFVTPQELAELQSEYRRDSRVPFRGALVPVAT